MSEKVPNYYKKSELKTDTKPVRVSVSLTYYEKLEKLSKEVKAPIGRLLNIAIDNEFLKDKPFELDLTLPSVDDNVEYAYADESGKLLNYLRKIQGAVGLDYLMNVRHDIGVPDRAIFLACFAQCLQLDAIFEFKSPKKALRYKRPEDYSFYKIAPLKGEETSKKKNNKASRYNQYLKLQKEFENEA